MTLARQKVRGGSNDPAFKKSFVYAVFSDSVVLCATFDPVHLPIANAPTIFTTARMMTVISAIGDFFHFPTDFR